MRTSVNSVKKCFYFSNDPGTNTSQIIRGSSAQTIYKRVDSSYRSPSCLEIRGNNTKKSRQSSNSSKRIQTNPKKKYPQNNDTAQTPSIELQNKIKKEANKSNEKLCSSTSQQTSFSHHQKCQIIEALIKQQLEKSILDEFDLFKQCNDEQNGQQQEQRISNLLENIHKLIEIHIIQTRSSQLKTKLQHEKDCFNYNKSLQSLEAEIRDRIRVQQELRIMYESATIKNQELTDQIKTEQLEHEKEIQKLHTELSKKESYIQKLLETVKTYEQDKFLSISKDFLPLNKLIHSNQLQDKSMIGTPDQRISQQEIRYLILPENQPQLDIKHCQTSINRTNNQCTELSSSILFDKENEMKSANSSLNWNQEIKHLNQISINPANQRILSLILQQKQLDSIPKLPRATQSKFEENQKKFKFPLDNFHHETVSSASSSTSSCNSRSNQIPLNEFKTEKNPSKYETRYQKYTRNSHGNIGGFYDQTAKNEKKTKIEQKNKLKLQRRSSLNKTSCSIQEVLDYQTTCHYPSESRINQFETQKLIKEEISQTLSLSSTISPIQQQITKQENIDAAQKSSSLIKLNQHTKLNQTCIPDENQTYQNWNRRRESHLFSNPSIIQMTLFQEIQQLDDDEEGLELQEDEDDDYHGYQNGFQFASNDIRTTLEIDNNQDNEQNNKPIKILQKGILLNNSFENLSRLSFN